MGNSQIRIGHLDTSHRKHTHAQGDTRTSKQRPDPSHPPSQVRCKATISPARELHCPEVLASSVGHRRREFRKGNGDGSTGYSDNNDPVDKLYWTAGVDACYQGSRDAEP